MHLILLDNGRTQAYREQRFRATLQCIRCGACMNHWPVYTRVGGLSYGTPIRDRSARSFRRICRT